MHTFTFTLISTVAFSILQKLSSSLHSALHSRHPGLLSDQWAALSAPGSVCVCAAPICHSHYATTDSCEHLRLLVDSCVVSPCAPVRWQPAHACPPPQVCAVTALWLCYDSCVTLTPSGASALVKIVHADVVFFLVFFAVHIVLVSFSLGEFSSIITPLLLSRPLWFPWHIHSYYSFFCVHRLPMAILSKDIISVLSLSLWSILKSYSSVYIGNGTC